MYHRLIAPLEVVMYEYSAELIRTGKGTT
jgi:hypothetical protein